MTLQEILTQVQIKLEASADEIDFQDDETIAKIGLANEAIKIWSKAKGTEWNELFATESLGRMRAGDNEFDLPTGINKVVGVMVGEWGELSIAHPIQALKTKSFTGYIEGNPQSGQILKINHKLAGDDQRVNQEIMLWYIKQPTLLEEADDEPEMSDPGFIVDYVCAELVLEDNPGLYSKFSAEYIRKLNDMIEANNTALDYSETSVLDDSDMVIGG